MNASCLIKFFRLIIIFSLFCYYQINAQDWHEKNDYKLSYNLSGKKILIIADDESTYEETVEMAEAWKNYGALVKIASPMKQFNATKMAYSVYSPSGITHGGKYELNSDLLISEVSMNEFSAVYLPGGESYESLTTKHKDKIAQILNQAHKQKKIIGAFCHGPAILSVTNFIKGLKITVEGVTAYNLLVKAGASIQDIPIICDKNVITCRFPFVESFIYTFAEKLQFPGGNGPLEKVNKTKSPFLKTLENLSGTYTYKNIPVRRDTIESLIRFGLKSVITEKYFYNNNIRFICVDDTNKIRRLKQLVYEKNKSRYSDVSEWRYKMLIDRALNAPVLLFTFNDLNMVDSLKSNLDKKFEESKLVFYNGAACQNLMLAANNLGLGANLIGTNFFRIMEKELKEFLNLPERNEFINLLGIGYPELKLVPTTSRPVSEFLSFDQYQPKND
jgi:putative intracellular protease/amidase/nitroreductase